MKDSLSSPICRVPARKTMPDLYARRSCYSLVSCYSYEQMSAYENGPFQIHHRKSEACSIPLHWGIKWGAAQDSQRSCPQGRGESGEPEATTEMMGMKSPNGELFPHGFCLASTIYTKKSPNGDKNEVRYFNTVGC